MKYSFIIPVYGCEAYLEECVESVLAQKGSHDFEVILVDDGSKDRSGQIADDLARRDTRIRTFHKENGGAASARNYGLREACGEYILFVDGDDTVEVQLLNQVDAALTENSEALIIYGMAFDYYRDNALVRSQQLSCGHAGALEVKLLLDEFKSFFYDNALSSACNKVFSAEIIDKKGLRMKAGMTLYEDCEFVLRYLSCIDTVNCIAHSFYHYRNDLTDNHLSHRVSDLDAMQKNLRQLLDAAAALPTGSSSVRDVMADLYMQLLWNHLKKKKYTLSELEEHTVSYCQEPGFREFLMQQATLGSFEGDLLRMIEDREFPQLAKKIRKRRQTALVKNVIKKLLGLAGIKR